MKNKLIAFMLLMVLGVSGSAMADTRRESYNKYGGQSKSTAMGILDKRLNGKFEISNPTDTVRIWFSTAAVIGTDSEAAITIATHTIVLGTLTANDISVLGALDMTNGAITDIDWAGSDDGAGSFLDADLLDGQEGIYYAALSTMTNYLQLAGGTMTGDIDMDSNRMLNISSITVSAPFFIMGDYVRIGNAGTVNYADGDGDLYVEDELEVDGVSRFAGAYFYDEVYVEEDKAVSFGTGWAIYVMKHDTNAGGDAVFSLKLQPASANHSAAMIIHDGELNATPDFNDWISPTIGILSGSYAGADASDYAGVLIGGRTTADISVPWYFDFATKTGALDGAVDATTTEQGPMIRFTRVGEEVATTHSISSGSVLINYMLEVDGMLYADGGIQMGTGDIDMTDNGITTTITDAVLFATNTYTAGYSSVTGNSFVSGDAEVDGDINFGGVITGDGSGLTNLPGGGGGASGFSFSYLSQIFNSSPTWIYQQTAMSAVTINDYYMNISSVSLSAGFDVWFGTRASANQNWAWIDKESVPANVKVQTATASGYAIAEGGLFGYGFAGVTAGKEASGFSGTAK